MDMDTPESEGPATVTLMTRDGNARLRRELETLTTSARRELADRLRQAREDGGDPAENGALMDAIDEQARLENRIRTLQMRLHVARIAPPPVPGTVAIGTRVRLRRPTGIVEYELVGAGEADLNRLRISVDSPVGQAVLGRQPAETMDVELPGGRVSYELLSVDPIETGTSVAHAAEVSLRAAVDPGW
jgi:transcription elongation factor GreA